MKTFITASILASATTIYAQYAIDPNSVSNATRQAWCLQQQTSCPLICLQTSANSAETESNDCDAASLTFACVCSNGISPNVSEYSQTLPFNICQEWGTQCVANCGSSDSACQAACRDDHPCGAQSPTRQNTSTLTSTMMSTTTTRNGAAATTDSAGETIYTGYGGAAATGNTESTAPGKSAATRAHVQVWALSVGQTFGTLALVGGFVGGFALLL